MLYHATDKETGYKIWEDGLKSNTNINNFRKKRQNMREHIDRLANKKFSNYVPRKNAIFAWPTFESARIYGSSHFPEPAIVEFSITDTAWCVESFIAEDLYENYSNNTDDETIRNVIENYRPWNHERNDELEVWLHESSIDSVHQVLNDYGTQFELR